MIQWWQEPSDNILCFFQWQVPVLAIFSRKKWQEPWQEPFLNYPSSYCWIIQQYPVLKDEFPKHGSSKNRKNNAPEKGKTSLLDIKNA